MARRNSRPPPGLSANYLNFVHPTAVLLPFFGRRTRSNIVVLLDFLDFLDFLNRDARHFREKQRRAGAMSKCSLPMATSLQHNGGRARQGWKFL